MTVFTETEIKDLLKREEGQFLEFKSLWDRESGALKSLSRRTVRDIIAEYIAAFANADGGTLVLGVEDDGTPSGHNYTEEALSGFIEVPVSRLRPSVNIRSQRMMVEGHELIIMDVPMSSDAIMVNGNGFPYRAGDQVLPRYPRRGASMRLTSSMEKASGSYSSPTQSCSSSCCSCVGSPRASSRS